jgi:hypothetical protein
LVVPRQETEEAVMPIALIEEESEIFQHYDAAMIENANGVDISFQDEFVDQPELEAAVRRFLAGEFVRQGHKRLREQGVAADLIPDEGDLPRSLEFDVFPGRDREALEQKLGDFVAQTIRDPEGTGDGGTIPPPKPGPPIKPAVSGSHTVGHMGVQVSTGFPGQRLGALPESPVPKPGRTDFIIVFLLTVQVGNLRLSSDAVRCTVDQAPFPLRPNQMLVSLQSQIGTATQIIAWNRARGAIATLQEAGPTSASSEPAEMLLGRDCEGADTLVFGRYGKGYVSYWVQLSHMDPGTFWAHFGGRRLSFNWVV